MQVTWRPTYIAHAHALCVLCSRGQYGDQVLVEGALSRNIMSTLPVRSSYNYGEDNECVVSLEGGREGRE